jgi:hypothetical protein
MLLFMNFLHETCKRGETMMDEPILFDGREGFGDEEYRAYVLRYPRHLVANVPNPERTFAQWEIKIHQAKCGHASNSNKGSLTGETQHKLVWDDLSRLKEYLKQTYPSNDVTTCGHCLPRQ